MLRREQIKRTQVIIGLFLVTLIWRSVYYSRHITFAQDQARDLMTVQEQVESGRWLFGYGSKASVADFHWPPLHYQILAFIGLVTGFRPLAPHWVIIILESLTPVFLYLTLSYWVKLRFALITAVMYAFSPLPTIYGTFSWNPNLIPLFSTISIYAWMSYYYTHKASYLLWGTLMPLLAFQLHFQAALIMLFGGPYLIWAGFRDRKALKMIGLGLGLALLFYLPYLGAEINQGWHNTTAIINFFTRDHPQIYDRVSKPNFLWTYMPGFYERVLTNRDWPGYGGGRLLLLGGSVLIAWLSYKQPKKYLILGLLLISMLIMVRVYKGDKLDYYLSALFVMPFLLTGIILNQMKIAGVSLGVVLTVLAGSQTLAIPAANDYQQVQEAARQILQGVTGPFKLEFENKDLEYPLIYTLEQRGVKADTDATQTVHVNQDYGVVLP